MGYLKSISKFLVAGTLFSSLFVTSAFASNLGKVTGDVVTYVLTTLLPVS